MAKKNKVKEFLKKAFKKLKKPAIAYTTKLILRRLGFAAGGFFSWLIAEVLGYAWDRWLFPLVKRIHRSIRKKQAQRRADDVDEADSENELDDAIDNMP